MLDNGSTDTTEEVPTPQVAVVTRVITATPQIVYVTATLEPTDTPTHTPTISPSPTYTPTLTITPTPTQTPIPKFVWATNLEYGIPEGLFQGARAEIIDDPTHSGKGKVLRGTISGQPVDQGTYMAYRAHSGKSFPFQSFPCRVQEDIWMSNQLFNDIQRNHRNWYSQLSLFDKTPQDGGTYRVPITTMFGDGAGYDYMTLDMHDPDNSAQQFQPVLSGAPKFTAEEWHTMAVDVDATGMTYLYQDNKLVTKGEIPQKSRKGLVAAHGGPIYGGPSFSEGGYVLVDNFRITCW